MLSRDQIVQARQRRPLPTEKVPTPEWAPEGADPAEAFVYVRTLTEAEKGAWELSLARDAGGKVSDELLRAKLVAACVCDADGRGLFSEADVELLGQQDSRPLRRLGDAALRLNAVTEADREELRKN